MRLNALRQLQLRLDDGDDGEEADGNDDDARMLARAHLQNSRTPGKFVFNEHTLQSVVFKPDACGLRGEGL